MTGRQIFISYSSDPEGAGKMRSALADAFRKFEPAVSGVRINIASGLGGGAGQPPTILVDLCMSAKPLDPNRSRIVPSAYFILLDHGRDHGCEPTSLVWKWDKKAAHMSPSAESSWEDFTALNNAFSIKADEKLALRLMFQAKNATAANQAAQTLCSQLARENVGADGPDKAAERIYLWLMQSPDGQRRADLRLRDLQVFNGWCDLAEPSTIGFKVYVERHMNHLTQPKPKATERSEELRMAFVDVLRRTAFKILHATTQKSNLDIELSDAAADYVSAAHVLKLYYGEHRAANENASATKLAPDRTSQALAREHVTSQVTSSECQLSEMDGVQARGRGQSEIEARPSLYARHGLNRQVFEFLILRYLETQGQEHCSKADVYDALARREGFHVGDYAAFCTRLAKLKNAGLVDWRRGQHRPAIEITREGIIYRQALVGANSSSLSGEQRECLATTVGWSGLERSTQANGVIIRWSARL